MMISFFIAAGSLLAITAQGFPQNSSTLPTVDLGYALYRASAFNVGGPRWQIPQITDEVVF
jgi:hypothetical protein